MNYRITLWSGRQCITGGVDTITQAALKATELFDRTEIKSLELLSEEESKKIFEKSWEDADITKSDISTQV